MTRQNLGSQKPDVWFLAPILVCASNVSLKSAEVKMHVVVILCYFLPEPNETCGLILVANGPPVGPVEVSLTLDCPNTGAKLLGAAAGKMD